jgi:hypothetical protein
MLFARKTLTAACADVILAVEKDDQAGYGKALQAIVNAARAAQPEEVEAAVGTLTPAVEGLALEMGGALAGVVASLAVLGTSGPATALPVLVDRACAAAEEAARFAAVYRSTIGALPSSDDHDAFEWTLNAVRTVAVDVGLPEQEMTRLAEAWFVCGDWLQPVLFLSQRKDVRLALPQRQRLTDAILPIADYIETARWLRGLLRVIDDAPLAVLHPETERGYLLTIGGVGDNLQLHTLLAAHLIGSEDYGLLPGEPPSAAMVAAATTGNPTPAGGIMGQFNMVDAGGTLILGEGSPADIPAIEGERIVLLHPLSDERSWKTGRVYPLMRPELVVRRHLTPPEVADRLARIDRGCKAD